MLSRLCAVLASLFSVSACQAADTFRVCPSINRSKNGYEVAAAYVMRYAPVGKKDIQEIWLCDKVVCAPVLRDFEQGVIAFAWKVDGALDIAVMSDPSERLIVEGDLASVPIDVYSMDRRIRDPAITGTRDPAVAVQNELAAVGPIGGLQQSGCWNASEPAWPGWGGQPG